MRILHITDSHCTVKTPEGRKDVYYVSFLKKLYEIGFVCRKTGVNMVIHTGDLFHSPTISNKLAGEVSELIKGMDIPFYVVPGNHDIKGYTTDTISQTTLGLLGKAKVVTILDRKNPFVVTEESGNDKFTIGISGQEFYSGIDSGCPDDFLMGQPLQDFNILCCHGYIADTPQNPNIKCTMVQDVVTDADIILCGHYHRSFSWSGNDFDIFNPGSMMRVEQTEYNKTFTPQYGILDITLDNDGSIIYDYNMYKFRTALPSSVIFDYSSKYKVKTASITLDGFQSSISNTVMKQAMPSVDITAILKDIYNKNNIPAVMQDECNNAYNKALRVSTDLFEVQQGYIADQGKKRISCIDIHNFQSHENTHMDFTDGLNIIVGESNNGKTAIMRAIMWCIDNTPQGNSFIMAGKKECHVKITYDDGTFIERGRTVNDAGYYKVCYKDANGNLCTSEYKGFSNAIPVEVANIHQMPKINITKDIETHLNVLSQLDKAFLLPESPQVKASAIGRITGTHIIDAAMKELSRETRANKILLKDTDKDYQETIQKLAAMPDVNIMESTADGYGKIVQYMESSGISEAYGYMQQVNDYDARCSTEQGIINKSNSITWLKGITCHASALLKWQNSLSGMLDRHKDIMQDIAIIKTGMSKYSNMLLFMPVIAYAHEAINKVKEAQECMSYKNMYDIQEKQAQAEISANMKLSSLLSAIYRHIADAMPFIRQACTFMANISAYDSKIKSAAETLQEMKTETASAAASVQEISDNRIKLVKEHGICPCCKTPFKKHDTAEEINKFMEEHMHA